MKKLIETIVSEVLNTFNKQGYSTYNPELGVFSEQYQGMSGGAGGQGNVRGSESGKGKGGGGQRGGKGRGGGGCGGR